MSNYRDLANKLWSSIHVMEEEYEHMYMCLRMCFGGIGNHMIEMINICN